MCDETRRWLADPTVARVDPVCEEDNPLMTALWPDREPYGTLIISARRWGVGAPLRAGIIDLKAAGRRTAKTLIKQRFKLPIKRLSTTWRERSTPRPRR
jgi:hypothetical protein